MDFTFIYDAFEAVIGMIDKLLIFFSSTIEELLDLTLPDWLNVLFSPITWIIDTLGWGEYTMIEVMFVVGLPLILVLAFIKFFRTS